MVFDARPPAAPPAPGAPPGAGDEQGRRIVDATLRVVARHGLSKLTLDDVAREAGCSRATLYRRFPGKTTLLDAVVGSETARLERGLDEVLADVGTLPDAMAAVAAYGSREFSDHAALQFLLAYEPGAVLPHLTFAGAERLLGVLADRIAPHLGRFMPSLQARRVGEWLGRIVLSYGCTPLPPGAAFTRGEGREAAVVSIVHEFVAPALAGGEPREATDD